MKIYIVYSEHYDYESSSFCNIKAFVNKNKANEFVEDLELRNIILHDELKKIEEEKRNNSDKIRTMNLTKEVYIKKLLEIGKKYTEERERLIKESGLEDMYIGNDENEGFGIEELELDESE